MLRNSHRRCGLRVVPRSPPPPLPYHPPSSRVHLLKELRRSLSDPIKEPELSQVISSMKTLLPSLFPRDFVLVAEFVARQSDNTLRGVVLNRVSELSVDEKTLLKLARCFPDRQSQKQISHLMPLQTLTNLNPKELIQLMFLKPELEDKILSLLSPKKITFYQMASIANFTNRKHKFFALLAKEVVHRHEVLGEVAKPRDVALLMNAYTSFGAKGDLFECLEKNCMQNHEKFAQIEIPIILHALAKQGSPLFAIWADWLSRNIASLNDKGIGMIAYAYGQVGQEALFPVISEYMQRHIDVFSLRSIAMVLFGFSKLGIRDQTVVKLIERELVWREGKRKYQYSLGDVAMLAKGLAVISDRPSLLNDVLVKMIKAKQVSEDHPDSVIKLVEGFSNFPQCGKFDSWVAKSIPQILHVLTGRDINILLSSLVKMGVTNRVLFQAINDSVDFDKFNFKLIPQFVKLISKLDMYDSRTLAKCSKIVSVHLGSYTCEDLLDFLHGLSQFNHRDERVLARVMQAIQFQLRQDILLTPNQLVVLLNSVVRLRIGNAEPILKQIFENLTLFNSERAVCNSLFALATVIASKDIESEWIEPIIDGLLDKLEALQNISLEGIRQVQIFNMAFPNNRTILQKMANVNTFEAAQPSIEQSSATHREISRYLSLLGQEHRNEVVWGPFSLDIMLPNNVVIEIDGPHHFFRDSTLRTSSSLLKHKLMVENGLHVKHVPYQEWLQCTNEARKLSYVSALVDDLPSHTDS